MRPSKTLVIAGFSAALAVSSPVFAQRHGGGGGGHAGNGGSHSQGGGAHVNNGAGNRAAAPVNRGAVANRSAVVRPQAQVVAPRYVAGGRAYVAPSAAVRGGVYVGPHGAVVASHSHYYPHVAPVRFYRPYYTFHPHVSLGFGLYVGYPFAYSYGFYNPFYYPYGYAAPYAYPPYPYPAPAYPPASSYPGTYPSSSPQTAQGSIGVQPGQQQQQTNEGGLSFEITPAEAQLFIDGTLVGTVGQFTPTSQPLGLTAGRHHVEIRAQGYQTMSFDVDIVAGQVIPYQGTMQR
jgi:hypothetical protein